MITDGCSRSNRHVVVSVSKILSTTRWSALTLAMAIGAGALFGVTTANAASTMKLATATINDVQHEWQKEFAVELQQRVGDAVEVEIYPASQLGPIPRMTEGVLLGTIEAFTTPTAFMTSVDPRFQAFDVPGLFNSPEAVVAALHDPEYRDYLETMFLNKGLRVIGAMYNSPTVVFTMEPATMLADLDGKKVRTFASPMQIKPMESIGVTPLPLALSEVVPQLQNGGLDGLLVGMPILTAFKYYDIGKHITDLRFAEIVSLTLINEVWFQGQSDEVKQAIVEAGRAAEMSVYPWGVKNVERTYALWKENGGEVHQLNADEQTKMEAQFSELAVELVNADEAVKEEYEKLKALVDAL